MIEPARSIVDRTNGDNAVGEGWRAPMLRRSAGAHRPKVDPLVIHIVARHALAVAPPAARCQPETRPTHLLGMAVQAAKILVNQPAALGQTDRCSG